MVGSGPGNANPFKFPLFSHSLTTRALKKKKKTEKEKGEKKSWGRRRGGKGWGRWGLAEGKAVVFFLQPDCSQMCIAKTSGSAEPIDPPPAPPSDPLPAGHPVGFGGDGVGC